MIRNSIVIGLMAFTLGTLAGTNVNCTPADRRAVAKGALDVASVGCVLANMWFPVEQIAQVCDIANDVIPDIRKIVDMSRRQAMAGAPRCALDGGVCQVGMVPVPEAGTP